MPAIDCYAAVSSAVARASCCFLLSRLRSSKATFSAMLSFIESVTFPVALSLQIRAPLNSKSSETRALPICHRARRLSKKAWTSSLPATSWQGRRCPSFLLVQSCHHLFCQSASKLCLNLILIIQQSKNLWQAKKRNKSHVVKKPRLHGKLP